MVTGALIRVGFLEGDEGLSEVTECVNKGVRRATFSAFYSVWICSGLVADVVKDEWVRRMFNAIFQE